MPTARPIITASTGVMLLSSIHWVEVTISSTPMPTPITAVITGITAAATEPKVMIKTMKAKIRPMISLVVLMTIGSPKPGPPASTCMPCSRPKSMASLITWRCSSVTAWALSTSMVKVV